MNARIVLATRNPGKLREFRALLGSHTASGTLDSSRALGELDLEQAVIDAATAGCAEIPETGISFTENSLLKARAVAAETGLPAVADDSGLAVDVLGGAPGIFSGRWAGAQASDENNLRLLLEQLADIAPEHRGAAFVCVAALVVPASAHAPAAEFTTTGTLRGSLLLSPQGAGGFGYDPILQPSGETRSTAELSMEEKNAISHRGEAFAALRPRILEALTR